jgi:uncharacterized protein
MMTADRPYPGTDADSAPFWAACSEGRLVIASCPACQQRSLYLRQHCPRCGADRPPTMDASGRGTIYAWTEVVRAPAAFRDEAPYIVALVDLAEGARIMTRLDVADSGQVEVGAPVMVDFRPGPAGFTLPWFVLAPVES